MPNIEPREILVAVLTMLFVFSLWGMFIGWGWVIWRVLTGQSILPERPMVSRGKPPWGIGTVLFVFIPLIASQVNPGHFIRKADAPARGVPLTDTKAANVREKDDSLPNTRPVAPGPEVAPAVNEKPAAITPASDKKMPMYQIMLANSVAEIGMLALVLIVTRLTSGARLRDFGLSFEGWWRQVALGVAATLIAAPPVNAIQILAVKIWTYQPHPVQEMMLKEFSPGVGALAFVTAVILAPLFEELVFRGLLQSWLVSRIDRLPAPDSSSEADTPLIAEALSSPIPEVWELACEADEPRSPYEPPQTRDTPPGQPPNRAWLAIAVTSLLFGLVHASQWPAPIALFVLAVVIGTVYYRTGSLLAAISMHATFNGLSTLMLFLTILSGGKHLPDKVIGQTARMPGAIRIEPPTAFGGERFKPPVAKSECDRFFSRRTGIGLLEFGWCRVSFLVKLGQNRFASGFSRLVRCWESSNRQQCRGPKLIDELSDVIKHLPGD